MEAQISLLCRGSVRLRRESSVANGGIELRADGVPDEEVDDVNDDPVSPSWSSAGFSSEMTKLIAIYRGEVKGLHVLLGKTKAESDSLK